MPNVWPTVSAQKFESNTWVLKINIYVRRVYIKRSKCVIDSTSMPITKKINKQYYSID